MKTLLSRRALRFGVPVLLGAVALTSLFAVTGCNRGDAAPDSPPPAPPALPVTRAAVQTMPDTLTFTGRVQAVHHIGLRSRVGGQISAVFYREGTRVLAGTPLFEVDPRPFRARRDHAAAEVAQARSTLRLAEQDLARARRLREDEAIAAEELDRRIAGFDLATAQSAAAEARLAAAKLELEFTVVRAPVEGEIGRALTTAGNHVDAGATVLATLVSTDPVHVLFDIDEPTYHRVQAQARASAAIPVSLTVAGLDAEFAGTLDYVANVVDSTSGTAQVRALFRNPDANLAAGMFARVELQLPATADRVLVPETAIGAEQGSRFVLVVGADHKVEQRRVTLGPRFGDRRAIARGLAAGDTVLLAGLQWLRPGMVVQPVEPAPQSAALTLSPTQH